MSFSQYGNIPGLLDACEFVSIVIRWINEDGQATIASFSKAKIPPETFRCDKEGCSGQGVSILQPFSAVVMESARAVAAGAEATFSRKVIDECRGMVHSGGTPTQFCGRRYEIEISGKLRN